MRKASRVVLLGFVLLTMLTQFTNCGAYQTPQPYDGLSAVACENSSCVLESADNLRINVNLGDGQYSVPGTYTEFNLGGDCNEGGFARNYIHWDLIDKDGRIVRHSGMQIAAGITAETQCVNGRFTLYVVLTPLPINNADPYDRTGLLMPNGLHAAYNLRVTIFASSSTTGAQSSYSTVVPLLALASP
jgi:hypothetical protein